jgi:DeoR/GlpR family transcriptional regulator of sugar metabolism
LSRKQDILRLVLDKGKITYSELEIFFPKVSNMTLRRDILSLEQEGFVVRTRGGAVARSMVANSAENSYTMRAAENTDAKMIIARKAVNLIQTSRSIYIDSGTTMMCFSRVLPDDNLFIITAGPNIALEVMHYSNPNVMLVGGNLNKNNLSASGPHSLDQIRHVNIDIAFMVASGYDSVNGFTCGTYSECELKRAIIEKARQTVLLIDSSKMNRSMPFTFADFSDINVLVTDDGMDKEVITEAINKGVVVL